MRRRLVPSVLVPAVLLFSMFLEGASPADATRHNSALWYRIEIQVTSTLRIDGANGRHYLRTSWEAQSNAAVILTRIGRNNFSFDAAINGEVTSHTGKAQYVRNGNPDCRYRETERFEGRAPLLGYLSSLSIRTSGVFVSWSALPGPTRVVTLLECGRDCNFSRCRDPVEAEQVTQETEGTFLGEVRDGRALRYQQGGFGQRRIVITRTVRARGTGWVTTYRIVFKRCPDQNLSRDCPA